MQRGGVVVAGLIVLSILVQMLHLPLLRWVIVPIVLAIVMVATFALFRARRPKEPTDLT